MELQLNKDYCPQTFVNALNIYNSYTSYSNPYHVILAIRYIYQHKHRPPREHKPPSDQDILDRCISLFDNFSRNDNVFYMRELADIVKTFSSVNKNILINRLRKYEDRKNTFSVTFSKDTFQPLDRPINILEKKIKTVYSDSQNVHNSGINSSVLKATKYLINMFRDILDSGLKTEILENIRINLLSRFPEKIELLNHNIDYIKNSIAVFGYQAEITMIDTFISVYLWIERQEQKEDLYNRLLEEIKEMDKLCTTGHLSRLINVIQGFTTDENLCVRISDKDQCISVVKQYLTKELMDCKDDLVLDGMIEPNDHYRLFIRHKISLKLLQWKEEYGSGMLDHIASVVNKFCNTEVFL